MEPTETIAGLNERGKPAELAADKTRKDNNGLRREIIPDRLGNFVVGPEIGRGGMGIVFQATELGLDRKVALKVLPSAPGEAHLRAKRFELEARAAAKLNHENIVPVYHIDEDKGTRYFAMKLIEGSDLAFVIASARRDLTPAKADPTAAHTTDNKPVSTSPNGAIDNKSLHPRDMEFSGKNFASSMSVHGTRSAAKMARSVAHVGQKVAEALQHAHDHGVIHRDIKPSNLMLDTNNKIWVTDFGLAQLPNSRALTRTGDVIGTLRYMSPEQASGRKAFVDNRTDIYSLGVTLYELATLNRACRGESSRDVLRELTFERPTPLRRINPRLPQDFETIITRATERNPADRYQTAAELAADLERFIRGESPNAKPPSKLKRARDWLYSRPLVTTLIAVCVLTSLFGTGTLAWALAENLRRVKADAAVTASNLNAVNSMYWSNLSSQLAATHPGLALVFAVMGADGTPDLVTNNALLETLDGLRERSTVMLDAPIPGKLVASRNGKWILRCIKGSDFEGQHTARVFDSGSGSSVAALNSQGITTGVFATDDSFLIVAGSAYRKTGKPQTFEEIRPTPVTVWNTENFKLQNTLKDFYGIALDRAIFSPDDKELVLPKKGNLASVIRTSDWKEVGPVLRGHTDIVIQAIYSPDGRHIATWGMDKTIRVWDAESGEQLQETSYMCPRCLNVRIAFSPNSEHLMIQGGLGIRIFQVADMEQQVFLSGRVAKFSKETSRNLIYYTDAIGRSIFVYAQGVGKVIREIPAQGAEIQNQRSVSDFFLLDRERYIATVSGKVLHLYNADEGSFIGSCSGHDDLVYDAIPVSNNLRERMCSISWDGTLRIWDTQSDVEKRTLSTRLARQDTPRISFSADGKKALLSTKARFSTSFRNAQELARPNIETEGEFKLLMADGRFITKQANVATLWDAKNSKRVKDILVPGQGIFRIYERLSDQSVVFETEMGQVYVWNIELDSLTKLNTTGESVVAISVHPETSRTFLGFKSGKLDMLEPNSLERVNIADFKTEISFIDCSLDAKQVLITTERRLIEWSVDEQTRLSSVSTGDIQVWEAFYAMNDTHAVSHAGAVNTKVALWELASGLLKSSIDVAYVERLASNADKNQFAIAANTGGAYLWDLDSLEKTQLTTDTCRRICFSEDSLLLSTHTNVDSSPQAAKDADILEVGQAALLVWSLAEKNIETDLPLSMNVTEIQMANQNLNGTASVILSGVSYGADLVDLQSVQTERSFMEHSTGIVLAGFSYAGTVVTVSVGGRILHYKGGTAEPQLLANLASPVAHSTLAPDGRILLTTDKLGTTWQTSLETSKSQPLSWNAGIGAKHFIGGDSYSVISLNGTATVRKWDLRATGDATELTFDAAVHDAVWAAESKFALLIRGEKKARTPPSKLFEMEHIAPKGEPDAWLLDTQSMEPRPLTVEGDILDAQFVLGGKKLAILTNEGIVKIFDSISLEKDELEIEADVRYSALSTGYDDKTLFAMTYDKIVGWNLLGGQQQWAIPAHTTFFDWQISAAGMDSMVIYDDGRARKIPVDLLEYARQLGPRELSPQEKRRYLLPFQQEL